MSTDWIDLHYKVFINFSSSVKLTVSDVWQCVTKDLSYYTLTMMSLLHVSQQWDIIAISHRVNILCIEDIIWRQTLSSLQALTELSYYFVSLSLSKGVNHHELICWWQFRSFLVTLSLKNNRLAHQRWVFTVVHSCEFKCLNVDDLYTLHQHLHKIQQKI